MILNVFGPGKSRLLKLGLQLRVGAHWALAIPAVGLIVLLIVICGVIAYPLIKAGSLGLWIARDVAGIDRAIDWL